MQPEQIAALCLTVTAVAHSVLGEVGIIRPLLAAEWSIDVPRWAADRILRFAWHLTSLAWLALAALVVGADRFPIVGAMALCSAAAIFIVLRGHLAWPVFLLAGLAALRADGVLGSAWLRAGALAAVVALLAAAALHVYWALGGRWMLDRALPPTTGSGAAFEPGRGLTLLVAGALAAFAAMVIAVVEDRGPGWLRWLVGAGVAVLALRAAGDGKIVGFTKKVHDTDFARADDRWFTPLVVFLALGAAGALAI